MSRAALLSAYRAALALGDLPAADAFRSMILSGEY